VNKNYMDDSLLGKKRPENVGDIPRPKKKNRK
jgi:hypothetical protein